MSADTTHSTSVGAKVTIPMMCEWWIVTHRVSALPVGTRRSGDPLNFAPLRS